MKANLRSIRKLRVYSDEFKKQLVSEFEGGKHSVLQLEQLHGVPNSTIYNWIYKYSTFNAKGYRIIEMKESTSSKVAQMQQRIKELESIVGRKQIMIDYLEKMMDIAKDELNIDIKKNFATPQSSGSKKIEEK